MALCCVKEGQLQMKNLIVYETIDQMEMRFKYKSLYASFGNGCGCDGQPFVTSSKMV